MALIEDYGLVGDLQTAALVGRDGSVDWLCLPRFDSPACFAALLHDERAGLWRLAPAVGGSCTRRSYRGDSLVLQTEWDTSEGTVRVIDFMPPRGEAADLVRIVEGLHGRVPMKLILRLRMDYGQIMPWVRHHHSREATVMSAVAGPDAVWPDTPTSLHGEDLTTRAEFEVAAGDRIPFVLTYAPSYRPRPTPVDAEQALRDTEQFWTEWLQDFDYRGRGNERWSAAVRRSLVLLKALTYAPSGGIVAAATTSLPEQIGGPRNWDYRYCWLRDATFTLEVLLEQGYTSEAEAWRDWLLRAVAGDPEDMQIMYGVLGERRLREVELDLDGYESSRPVRVGNAAHEQFQLDVYGEVMDSFHSARRAGLPTPEHAWELEKTIVEFVCKRWREPDEGIWEVRSGPQHFVHSKVMAWVAVDRGIKAVEDFGLAASDVAHWRDVREEIRNEVFARGVNAARGCFRRAYDDDEMDASLLVFPLVGFIEANDPMMVRTVEAIEQDLLVDGFLLRYRSQVAADGLPPGEGAFLMCSFWLVDCLVLLGRIDRAREIFERLVRVTNDLGLLSEQYDPSNDRLLGNFPQAFSHVALVTSALALAKRTSRPIHRGGK